MFRPTLGDCVPKGEMNCCEMLALASMKSQFCTTSALPLAFRKLVKLLDSLLRYFDGSVTLLDIAQKHELPCERVAHYVRRFEEKGLVAECGKR